MAKHYWRPISQGVKESERSGSGRIFYRTQVWSLASLVTNWLTHWLTNCLMVDLIDVTLACEDTNSKLFEVVTVADIERVDDSLLQIWKLKFWSYRQIFVQTLSTRFRGWSSSKILSWILVSILLWSLILVRSWVWTRFWSLGWVEMLMFGWDFEVDARLRLWRWKLIKICVRTFDMT